MSKPCKISMIAAMTPDRVIGKKGSLPWKKVIDQDIRNFRRITSGKAIIVGRKTFTDDLCCHRLAGRTNIVMTQQEGFEAPGCIVAHSQDEAIDRATGVSMNRGHDEIIVIGGAAIYELFLDVADRIYATIITRYDRVPMKGDAYFPVINAMHWRNVSHARIRDGEYNLIFATFERISLFNGAVPQKREKITTQ